jgi:polysaccharide biosynthesis/export protein
MLTTVRRMRSARGRLSRPFRTLFPGIEVLVSVRNGVLAVALCISAPLFAQQQPSGSSAKDIQTALQASGLTLSQIRTRLKSSGFSETLLDSYFSGTATAAPDSNVFAAVRALGADDQKEPPPSPTSSRPTSTNAEQTGRTALPRGVTSEFLDSVIVAAKDEQTRKAILDLINSKEKQQARLDSGTAVFGLDVFERETNLFDANDAGPVPQDYRLGPGDELVLVLTGDTERSYLLPVTREGMLFIPNVGAVPVANLTMRQLDDVLYSRLGRVYSGIRRGPGATAHFQVTVAKLGSNQVSVLGDVVTPGAYRISKLGTVLTAMYAAGGPASAGSLRQIEVRRAGKLVGAVDLYEYLISGNSTKDIRLESGDVILVPARGPRVRLSGAVIRPATYELKPGESLGDLIRMAGGFRPEADRRRVQVQRLVPVAERTASGSDRVLFDVAGASLEQSREPLYSGDVVSVGSVAGRVANQVRVTGNVWSPGLVAYAPGMRVSEALQRAGGVKTDTYTDVMQISRLQPDLTRKVLRIRVPGTRDADGAGETVQAADDMLMLPDDELRVFSQTEYRPERFVTIGGAVNKGGQFPYREGMTVRDLVMQAGGVKEGALLTEAEIARMPADRTQGATAITMRTPLDSTYLFDRQPGQPYQGPPGLAAPTRRAPEVELKAYDNVLILKQPDWELPRLVTVSGEVRYPGQYALRTKSERLADLIDRAGGLTPTAYPQGIVFTRSQNEVGRIGVDLAAAIRDRSHTDNLILVDGDVVEIPIRLAVVTVTGEVNSPISVPYQKGASLDYYVYGAGGPTARGDIKRSYVMQPNGKVESKKGRLLWMSTPEPQPGSTVSVPELPPPKPRVDIGAVLATTTSILTSILAIATLVGSR